ncbi:hypothetical protein BH10ACI1_BH10ACI1_16970 [soil metagenome]
MPACDTLVDTRVSAFLVISNFALLLNVKYYPLCNCGTALAERTLQSGESQIIQFNLPDKVECEFEVEFAGGEHHKE